MDKILIIEDNGVLCKCIVDMFSEYHCISAHSYASALDRWEESSEEIKCIISDLSIPAFGLSNQEIIQYRPLFGMAFINEIINEASTEEEKGRIKGMIIIYSAYVDILCHDERNNPGGLFSIASEVKTLGKGMNENEVLSHKNDSLTKLKKMVDVILSYGNKR